MFKTPQPPCVELISDNQSEEKTYNNHCPLQHLILDLSSLMCLPIFCRNVCIPCFLLGLPFVWIPRHFWEPQKPFFSLHSYQNSLLEKLREHEEKREKIPFNVEGHF